ncbi:hypothetical protein D9615_004343 [Tricholomella constricta]|uniref:Cupin type-2 domain-containing protein n=1 Tax=Tricholomella constricta TaxID=117010 RepID=A0A8H5HFB8_9AGAR|nr:hypothetical protein D9615_004343 [Tricholomella constricta]
MRKNLFSGVNTPARTHLRLVEGSHVSLRLPQRVRSLMQVFLQRRILCFSEAYSSYITNLLFIQAFSFHNSWHRQQDEWFKVLSGRVGYVLNGKEGYASAGDLVSIPRGSTHTFWCDPSIGEDADLEFTARPGTGIDAEWLNTVYGIMDSLYRQGQTLGFLQVMVFALESDSGPGALPKWLGIILVAIFSRIGLLAGYKATHPIYKDALKADATSDATGVVG